MEIESEKRYASILLLQEELNSELRNFFEFNMDKGREFLSSVLVDKIESIVEDLNTKGFNFGPRQKNSWVVIGTGRLPSA